MRLIEITIEILAVSLVFAAAVVLTVRRNRPEPIVVDGDVYPIRPMLGSYGHRSRN